MAIKKLGRYEIISEIGQGAMGVVYKAVDPLIERTVAIKTIKLDLSKEELASFEARFYREAQSAGRLNHPNIVTIYDVGKSDDIAYMAMEFLEGNSLSETLNSHTPIPLDTIADIAAQVADGLAYAHENGIVHRDIKPANIMIVRDGVAKITDFGIAQMPTGSRTLAGTMLGSPKYMSPEQVIGQSVDGRSDIFSLGVVLYEMLTGESPFSGDNISTIMYRILNEDPPPPRTVNPRVPDALDFIVSKTLAKHPDDRYQTAKELANDLRNFAQLNVTASRPVIPHRSMDRRSKPRANMGDETLFLNQISGGLIGSKASSTTTSSGNTTIRLNDTIARRPAFWESRKILFAAIALLLAAFVATILLGQHEQLTESASPAPYTVSPVPVRPPAAEIPAADAQTPVAQEPPPPAMTELTHPEGEKRAVRVEPEPKIAVTRSTSADDRTGEKAPVVLAPPATEKSSQDASKGQSTLSFAISPWGEIYVDGEKVGVSPPLMELTVPAGKHRIEIRNLNFEPYSETMYLASGSARKIKHKFK
jgi:serine/threonine protein kinase